jgi:hypothetical protein
MEDYQGISQPRTWIRKNMWFKHSKCLKRDKVIWLAYYYQINESKGIMVDPLKIQDITEFPPPKHLCQLQSIQGKTNFCDASCLTMPLLHMDSYDFYVRKSP